MLDKKEKKNYDTKKINEKARHSREHSFSDDIINTFLLYMT